MTILHGSWLPAQQRFFVWAETWRRLEEVAPADLCMELHPYCLSAEEFQALPTTVDQLDLGLLVDRFQARWREYVVALPTVLTEKSVCPQLSGQPHVADVVLYPWRVSGVMLPTAVALNLLTGLPLGSEASVVGGDLRYWSHMARWSLDLMARGKFVPAVSADRGGAIATWQLLLNSAVDQARLRQFSDRMPLVCQLYQALKAPTRKTAAAKKNTKTAKTKAAKSKTTKSKTTQSKTSKAGTVEFSGDLLAIDLPSQAPPLLQDFVASVVSAKVCDLAKVQPLPATAPLSKDLPLREWVGALTQEKKKRFESSPAGLVRLNEALHTWTAPLQNLATDALDALHVGFHLMPPPSGELNWTLHYGLEASDDDVFCLDAQTIWQHPVDQLDYRGRTVDAPQEKLLAGLGRAARLCEPIKTTLSESSPSGCSLDPIQAFEFIKATANRLQDNGFGVTLPENLVDPTKSSASRLGLSVKAMTPPRKQQRLGLQSLLNFEWELSIGGQNVSQREFEQLIAQQTPLVEVNGQWVELRPQDVKAAQSFFTSRQTKNKLSVEEVLRISSGDGQLIDKLPVVAFHASGKLDELITTLTTGNQSLEEMEEPDGFEGKLRPYQARGVSWLTFLEQWGLGACLADDMGLGKTIQLIAFLLNLKQEAVLSKPVLLVCPTSVLSNWQREVKRFGPELTTLVYHGDKRPKGATFVKQARETNLIVTSYTLVYRDLKELKRVDWQGLVLDEAQNIKNSDAKQSKAVRELESDFRIALTGTPVENRLSELWSIMDFLNPNYLGPKNFFQRRFATPIERYGDTDSLRTLRGLVQPFILRRLKTDRTIIQDLPEKQEMTVFCGLSAEQGRLYQKAVDEALANIDEADGVKRRGMILGLLVKLKQICNHPAQYLKQASLGKQRRSAKLQRLNEMLEEVISEGDRALIFTQFAEWGNLLQSHLKEHLGEDALFLYGSTSQPAREAMVDRFQQDPNGPKLFILSLKAGGVGLNLTRANHVFHFDRWWNPAVENQATDRAFRIGQTRNVQVHKFVCSGTLEERINDMIESKKALAEQVVGAGEQWLTELDTDQLRELLLLDRKAVIDES
ncbi:DEAD/DEAH box helicase [Leptolyngbya cf. ectocarpi LEGE 11479]|uniref:DEAD/DEAH box helicase n=1 Tax=Leptolyngbya cf. ectocarpi LEGE 11479 TaxID=1828722 RepID=A0A928WXH8_LEPEC|nr:DEAD/DEAH box helicase [Leptolyngbya ectocarpi]MBE9065167.1 DEAD/DEAH box helicase [Leptolyngbya cf. ectocarpi LEGE 11479]